VIATADERGPWAQEALDLVTAASGGLLFGIPMLFTMEVWWTGAHTTPAQALGMLAIIALPVFLLNRTDGFRRSRDVSTGEALMDTVEAVAIGLVLVATFLVLLKEITPDTPLAVGLGKVVYEALPFCLGIGVSRHFLRGGRDGTDDDDDDGGGSTGSKDGLHATVADLGATAIGALFIALNISPTDEVPMLTAALGPLGILAVMAASLLVSYGIVFVAGFGDQDRRHGQEGPFQRPATETIVCYLVALACSALMLSVFQRLGGPWPVALDHVIVLGLPATVGGAAGRLAI
jgi:putative integral membrane protein (TIGR02587 family)